VRSRSVQGQTLSLCLALAALVFGGAAILGEAHLGAALAVGIVIGSVNGFTLQAVLDRRAPILPTSIVRLALFSLLALLVARLGGMPVWAVVLGVGLAQLVMVGVGALRGMASVTR